MRIEYANLALVVALVGIACHSQEPLLPNVPPTLALLNSEAAFALNKRIKLSEADLYDLELIPKLSEAVAIRILEQRDRLIASAGPLPDYDKHSVLTDVRGIGKVTAIRLGGYLELE